MKKKYLVICALLIIGSIGTVSAVLFYQQLLSVTLISLDSAILVTDLADIPISDLGSLSLYIGEYESIFFKVTNNYDDAITLTFDVLFTGTGFSMMDGELGVNPNGSGYVGLLLGDPLVLAVGEYTEVGLAIQHTETAVAPGVEVEITVV